MLGGWSILGWSLLIYFNSVWARSLVGRKNSVSLSVAEFTSLSSWFLAVSKTLLSYCPGPFYLCYWCAQPWTLLNDVADRVVFRTEQVFSENGGCVSLDGDPCLSSKPTK